MSRPTFLEGVGVALAIAAVAGILFSVLTPSLSSMAVLHVLIAAVALTYLLYLLRRSRERMVEADDRHADARAGSQQDEFAVHDFCACDCSRNDIRR